MSFNERIEGNHIVNSSSATVNVPAEARWAYHSEAVLQGANDLFHKGMCVKATSQLDGSKEFSFEGTLWELEQATVKNIEIFGMSHLEIAYCFPQVTGLVRGVKVDGLTLNAELRPFLYAVPLSGLTSTGERKSFFARDFGVVAGDLDDLFGPLIANSHIGNNEPVWEPHNPKAWGLVFAHDLIEAEALAITRAQFTVDLISFALRTGISHFDTRYNSEVLSWDIQLGRSMVALHPWVLLREQSEVKGWIRTIPLIEQSEAIDLHVGYDKIMFFTERFLDASEAGDYLDQAGRRTLSSREQRLSSGIQRSLRWLAIASNEEALADRFIATWISLESVLNCIEYPGVFKGKRSSLRPAIEQLITKMELPSDGMDPLEVSEDLIRGRVLQGEWPVRSKLDMFAKSCGVQLRSDDTELVKNLGKLRGQIFHIGSTDCMVSREQLRRLEYLVERLVVAVSEYGYEDLEEDSLHQLRFGKLGEEGGAAPLFLNGREIPYRFTVIRDRDGQQIEEFVIEGKVYSGRNACIGFADD